MLSFQEKLTHADFELVKFVWTGEMLFIFMVRENGYCVVHLANSQFCSFSWYLGIALYCGERGRYTGIRSSGSFCQFLHGQAPLVSVLLVRR